MAVLQLTEDQKERIWQGQYWGPNGVLEEVRFAYNFSDQCFTSKVVLMSTEYSAASRALANLRAGSLRERIEAPLRFYDSAVRARRLALGAASQVTVNTVPDAVEVVTTLLVKLGCKKVARRVLDNLPWYDIAFRDCVAPHTKAFLIRNATACGLAEISVRNLETIQSFALQTEQAHDYRQALRVWRMLHGYTVRLAKRDGLRPWLLVKLSHLKMAIHQCEVLAESADQNIKLRASP